MTLGSSLFEPQNYLERTSSAMEQKLGENLLSTINFHTQVEKESTIITDTQQESQDEIAVQLSSKAGSKKLKIARS